MYSSNPSDDSKPQVPIKDAISMTKRLKSAKLEERRLVGRGKKDDGEVLYFKRLTGNTKRLENNKPERILKPSSPE
jgi:hypothetical protein